MTAPLASPEPVIEIEHVDRVCSCGAAFQAEVRTATMDLGPGRSPRVLRLGPGPTSCPTCLERQAAEQAARDAAEAAAEEARRAGELAERYDRAMPRKYRGAEFASLAPALQTELNDWRDRMRSIYLVGPYGTGKTYAAAALLADAWGRTITDAAWANVPILLDQLRRSIRKPDVTADQIERLCQAPLAVLDDIGAEKPSDWVTDRLYVVVNHRYENELPTIYTSNLSLGQLADRIGHRIASRIAETATQYELAGDDRRLTR